jgi:hypothetical protein
MNLVPLACARRHCEHKRRNLGLYRLPHNQIAALLAVARNDEGRESA